jgi:quinol monooxygenase YgiN
MSRCGKRREIGKMGDLVIVAYRPKPGQADALLAVVRDHVPTLRRLGLATDRPVQAMRAKDGTIVETFEWRDGAVAKAHENPDVLAMWGRFGEVCDIVPLKELAEAGDMFATFEPVEV